MITSEKFHCRPEPYVQFFRPDQGQLCRHSLACLKGCTARALLCREFQDHRPALLLHMSIFLDQMPSTTNLFIWGLWQRPSSGSSAGTSSWRNLEHTSLHSDSGTSHSYPYFLYFLAPWPTTRKSLLSRALISINEPHICVDPPDSQPVCSMKENELGGSKGCLQIGSLLVLAQQVIKGLTATFILAYCLNWLLRHLAVQLSSAQSNSWQVRKRLRKVGDFVGKIS